MTIHTSTAKMIYEDPKVARMILGKMKKSYPERKYELMKISTGWQVVGVKVLPAYMPPAKPAPVSQHSPKATTADTVLIEIPVLKDCPSYWKIDHSKPWLHKSHVISFELLEENPAQSVLRFTASKKSVKSMQLESFVKEAA